VIHVRQPGSLLIKYLVLSGALLFSIMARSSSGSSSTLAGVCVPVYDLAPGRILRAVEHASSLANEYADDAGEFYSMAMAELLVAAEVPTGAIIVLPLSEPVEDQRIDFSFLASSSLMYLQVFATSQPRMTYCHVVGYSTGTTDRPSPLGQKLKFPSVVNYVVAKEPLLEAVQEAAGPGVVIPGASAKRWIRGVSWAASLQRKLKVRTL
jgi:hypothetical protein